MTLYLENDLKKSVLYDQESLMMGSVANSEFFDEKSNEDKIDLKVISITSKILKKK